MDKKGKANDGYSSCDLKKSFSAYGANVRTSRLNKGGDMSYKGKKGGGKKKSYAM